MDHEKIFFFEVEDDDKKKVKDRFPKAQIFDQNINQIKNSDDYQNAEIICVFIYSKLSKDVLQKMKNLKLIITRSVGYDHIDLEICKALGIKVCNVPDYGSHVIAEHVFALLLSGLRHIDEADKRVEVKNNFNFHGLRGMALQGKTIGIIGVGKIGVNVARIASSGFLMNVLAYAPHQDQEKALRNHFKYVDLDQIWSESDIISLHCPLLDSTKHLINKNVISKMKDGVIIVNTSRGGIINTSDLVIGIKSGKISNVFLDVLEHEKELEKDKELIEIPGVITTPHIAFYADDSMNRMYNEAMDSIFRYLEDEELIHEIVGI